MRLTDSKYRREEGLFLAEGVKVVEELLSGTWTTKEILLLPDKRKYWEKIVTKLPVNVPRLVLSRPQWQKISQDKEPEGIAAVVALPQEPSFADYLTHIEGNILILCEINNPANLGSLLRSALWFGFTNIIISDNSVDYTNPKAVRSSMGVLFHLNIISGIDLAAALPKIKKTHYLIGSSAHKGLPPHSVRKKTALLLGNESHGVPDSLSSAIDELWCIPGGGKAESLSLPQAAAIMMYECAKK